VVLYCYHVSDPERYGVVEFDANFKAFLLGNHLNLSLIMRRQVCIYDNL
jgi:hypothetical protein